MNNMIANVKFISDAKSLKYTELYLTSSSQDSQQSRWNWKKRQQLSIFHILTILREQSLGLSHYKTSKRFSIFFSKNNSPVWL